MSKPRRRGVHQGVVGDQGDDQVHGHQHCDRPDRLVREQQPSIGSQEHDGDDDGQAEEQPAGLGRQVRGDGPGQAGDDDPDHRQLGVVAEAEVHVSGGAREDRGADGDLQPVGAERCTQGHDRGQQAEQSSWLACCRLEIDPGQRQRSAGPSFWLQPF
jgi:hypothetical protein